MTVADRYHNGVGVAPAALPHLSDSRSGACIVCGTAPGYWEEYTAACRLRPNAAVMGVNRFGRDHAEHCAYWFTVHPEAYFNAQQDLWPVRMSDKPGEGVDVVWPLATGGGSSALPATLAVLLMGHLPVLLAGVHLDGLYKSMRGVWEQRKGELAGRVFSVSAPGTFTRDLLGGPNEL